MANKTVPPEYKAEAFSCPHCGVYSTQIWIAPVTGIAISQCGHCHKFATWVVWRVRKERVDGSYSTVYEGRIIFPETSAAPMPSEDMPEEIKICYHEARVIVGASPRGAAALLRLCLQELMLVLGEKGDNLNEDIGSLVNKGALSPQIQKAMDGVRFFGNAAVHPGTINLNEDSDTALTLFELLNLIVEQTITADRKTEEFYAKIPQRNRDAIARRDGKQATDSEA